MSKFRIIILVFLGLALCGLGLIYMNISNRMDLIHQQTVSGNGDVAPKPVDYAPIPQPTHDTTQPVVVADPVVAEELAHTTSELERIKKENESLKRQQSVLEEERALLERRNQEKGDPQLQWLNDIQEAELVGRVTEYYKDHNLVIFQAVGQPSLNVGQELGIRRRGGIFAALIIDGDDADGKTYQAYVKRNKLFDSNDKEPIKPGDEVIIPPASWGEGLMKLEQSETNQAEPPRPYEVPMESVY